MTAKVLQFIPAKEQSKELALGYIAAALDSGAPMLAIIPAGELLQMVYYNLDLARDIDRVIALLEKTKYQLLTDWAEGEL